jgi:tRNA ligase
MSAFPTAIRDPPGKLKGFVAELDAMTEGSSKKRKMRRVAYEFAPSGDTIYSYSVPFEDAYKKEGRLPSKARGLFVRKVENDGAEIVVRGYDKFFNIGEVKATQWDHLEDSTRCDD